MPVNNSSKKVIVIAGPTASGKTAVAIDVAKYYNAQIISADSRQCFKELNIGVARPSQQELNQVTHHFIATHSIHEKVTAAVFETYALEKTKDLFQYDDTVVVVGGTGLYIKAFCEGMDDIPDVPEIIRNEVIHLFKTHGITYLQQKVMALDPDFYKHGEIKNPQRLMRALEVYKSTGRSILSFRKGEKANRPFNIHKFAINVQKEQLHHNISRRVDLMIERGLLEEVRSLLPYQHLNALQTVGYKELFDYFRGSVDLSTAIQNIKVNTRKYAKRQITWFKKDTDYKWVSPSAEEIIPII